MGHFKVYREGIGSIVLASILHREELSFTRIINMIVMILVMIEMNEESSSHP